MSFGKPGRPPEDRLARRREIFERVAPLVVEVGARQLSMRDAAHDTCLSIGGLYHYFPTKRALVLYGLDWEARSRICDEHRAALGDLRALTPAAYLDCYLDFTMRMFAFMRPSVIAAIELGDGTLQETLDQGLAINVGELAEALRIVLPDVDRDALAALARSMRRMALGALLDRQVDLDQVRGDLRSLFAAHLGAMGQPGTESTTKVASSWPSWTTTGPDEPVSLTPRRSGALMLLRCGGE